jgi:ferric-dicitrate binding protein FerR (iron transport regulator)
MRRDNLLADAARWFIDLITAADLNQLWPLFESWLQESPAHLAAYEQIERAWSKCDCVSTRFLNRVPASEVTASLH